MQNDVKPGRRPLPPEERAELAARVAAEGQLAVQAQLGLSGQTLARGLGGLPLQRGSRVIIRQVLLTVKEPARYSEAVARVPGID